MEADGRAFTLRRYSLPEVPAGATASELAWLHALADPTPSGGGVGEVPRTPRPRRRADGVLVPAETPAADGAPGALWTVREWVDGAPLGRLPDADEARAVGRLLGEAGRTGRAMTAGRGAG